MYPTEAVIDRAALRYNFHAIQRAASPQASIVPVIKSDGYGHGAAEVAKALLPEGAERFAVFRIEEALSLRSQGITAPLWVLLGALAEEIDAAIGQNFTLAIWSLDIAKKLNDACARRGITQDVHIKVDTGMSRLGVLPAELPAFVQALRTLPQLRIKGAFSHMAIADEPAHHVTVQQLNSFQAVRDCLPPDASELHLCATRAIIHRYAPELPFVRAGICIYGVAPEAYMTLDLKPVMTFRSRLISVKTIPAGASVSYGCTVTLQRDSRIAVVPVGYASGLPRQLTNACYGLVRGQRVPNLGTICMDMTMFDVTDVPDAAVDDEIVLFGKQGNAEIQVWELAKKAGTIPYDILCRIGMTQPRSYIN